MANCRSDILDRHRNEVEVRGDDVVHLRGRSIRYRVHLQAPPAPFSVIRLKSPAPISLIHSVLMNSYQINHVLLVRKTFSKIAENIPIER